MSKDKSITRSRDVSRDNSGTPSKVTKSLNMNLQSILDYDSDSVNDGADPNDGGTLRSFQHHTFDKQKGCTRKSQKDSNHETLASKNSKMTTKGEDHYKRYEPRAGKMQRIKQMRDAGEVVSNPSSYARLP